MKRIFMLPAVLLFLLFSTLPARASPCASNEVLVGEDAQNYYCKDRHEYSQCIRESGEALKENGQQCASQWAGCMKEAGASMTTEQAGCLTTCVTHGALATASTGTPFVASTCLVTCGLFAATWSMPRYATSCAEVLDSCNTNALIRDKAAQEACKH